MRISRVSRSQNMPRGHQLAVQPRQRTVVDRELHLDRRRINRHEGQRLARDHVGDRFADENILKAGHPHHIPGVGFGDLDAL